LRTSNNEAERLTLERFSTRKLKHLIGAKQKINNINVTAAFAPVNN